jgi:hypothetical protein
MRDVDADVMAKVINPVIETGKRRFVSNKIREMSHLSISYTDKSSDLQLSSNSGFRS